MFKKPENPKKVQEFEKINPSNKKKSLVSIRSRHVLHFKELCKNNSRNLQTRWLWISNKNIHLKFNRFPLLTMINF